MWRGSRWNSFVHRAPSARVLFGLGWGGVIARVMNELGMLGWALFGEGREVREEQVGWLVQKAEVVDEDRVAAGFSVLASVLLVD